MGWSFAYRDIGRKAHIEKLTNKAHFSPDYTPLEHRVVGNHVWQLVRIESTGRLLITLDLIAKARGEGWGYKGMSEDAGPYCFDCPLSLLDKASPVTEGYAVEWRLKVRAYHAKKPADKCFAGRVVDFGGHRYRLHHPAGPRKGWNVTRLSDGLCFRMTARQLANATTVNTEIA